MKTNFPTEVDRINHAFDLMSDAIHNFISKCAAHGGKAKHITATTNRRGEVHIHVTYEKNQKPSRV